MVFDGNAGEKVTCKSNFGGFGDLFPLLAGADILCGCGSNWIDRDQSQQQWTHHYGGLVQ